jgi:hypothetical protein
VSVMRVLSAWPGVKQGNQGRTSERMSSWTWMTVASGSVARSMVGPAAGGAWPDRCRGRGLVIKICGY